MRPQWLVLVFALGGGVVQGADDKRAEYRIEDARDEFDKAMQPAHDAYRHAVAKALASADRIEVCLLDVELMRPSDPPSLFETWDEALDEDQFPIVPLKKAVKILQRKVLGKEERAPLVTALQTMLNRDIKGTGVGCHLPVHGVRAWKGDKLIFRTSLCYGCGNYSFEYPDGSALPSMGKRDVEDVMKKFLPIPPDVMERFAAKNGLGKKGVPASAADQMKNAWDEYRIRLEPVEMAYRRLIAKATHTADKIEVYLLDFETKTPDEAQVDWFVLPEDQFPVGPNHRVSKILKRKTLNAAEIKQLAPVLRATLREEDTKIGGAACHFPIHGIRVWSGEQEIFRSSFCYHCENYYFEYPSQIAKWVGLPNKELEAAITQLMPIPQSEVDRFEAKWGDKDEKDRKTKEKKLQKK